MADLSPLARTISDAVDRAGLMLVHDRVVPSVTALVAGVPVAGSWWSHPRAHDIYNALNELEAVVASVKLIAGKETLVAPALWADLVTIGTSAEPWQTAGLTEAADALLQSVRAADGPVLCAQGQGDAARLLERRLLAYATDVHTGAGRHVKALQSWPHWALARGVEIGDGGAVGGEAVGGRRAEVATRRLSEIVDGLGGPAARRRLPW